MKHNKDKKLSFHSILKINKLVHEPARFLILAVLESVENADFLFLQKQTGLTRGNLSSHLSKLESSGYIDVKKEFIEKIPRTLLSITELGQNEFLEYCRYMHSVLSDCLE